MKKLLILAGLSGILASCSGLSSGGDLFVEPASVDLDSEFTVTGAAVPTQFRAALGGATYSGPIICDDRSTLLNFGFNYSGNLRSVNVGLRGSQGGFDPDLTAPVVLSNTGRSVLVEFEAVAGSVPLSKGSGVSAKAIIPTPIANPTIIGATQVELVANSPLGTTGTLRSPFVAVIDNCPADL